MNVYFVDADYHQQRDYDGDGICTYAEDVRFCGYFAAETRGQAHSDAIQAWNGAIDYIDPISIKNVGVTSAERGEINFDDFYNYDAMIDAKWADYQAELIREQWAQQ